MSLPARTDETQRLTEPRQAHPILCEATGAYCGRLGLEERLAAGRALRCCRSYWQPSVEPEGES